MIFALTGGQFEQCRCIWSTIVHISKIFFWISGVIGLNFLSPTLVEAQGKTYKGPGWNVQMYENCGVPVSRGSERSIKWVKVGKDKKLRFSLKKGDRGKCPTDDQARHGAPYWERAEVSQKKKLKLGHAYRIEFEATFLEGYEGERENFFQIHGWNGSCHVSPPTMLMFDRGSLRVWALRGVSGNGMDPNRGLHKEVQRRSVRARAIRGIPSTFTIDFDTRTLPGKLSVLLDGQPIVSNARVEMAPCAQPHIKMGTYRPGGKGAGTSTVLIDDLTINRISN